ncbi:hypothetical protein ACWF94_22075, partial [Streptomyces sp. NPDC055078]
MRRGRTAAADVRAGEGPVRGRVSRRTRARMGIFGMFLSATLALLQVPGPAGAVIPAWLASYETAPGARPVLGTPTSAGSPRLGPGTYTDAISAGERNFYRVGLDDSSNAYVSAVLVPPAGGEVGAGDGIRVTLESTDGARCSVRNDITFGSTTPRPIADYSTRRIGKGRECQSAGDYIYSVEWIGAAAARARNWTLELRFMNEPGLRQGTTGPSAPSPTRSPVPQEVRGPAKPVTGGSGFNDAPAIGRGLWNDTLAPGESRFYKVPVDWGQQLLVDGEFAGAAAGRAPTVTDGLRLTVFNTARGFAESSDADYAGRPTGVSLGTAPAAFANRTSDQDDISAMRFSGWYYLHVSLDRRIASPLPMT